MKIWRRSQYDQNFGPNAPPHVSLSTSALPSTSGQRQTCLVSDFPHSDFLVHTSWPAWDYLAGKYFLPPFSLSWEWNMTLKIYLSVLTALVGLLELAFAIFAVLQKNSGGKDCGKAQSELSSKGVALTTTIVPQRGVAEKSPILILMTIASFALPLIMTALSVIYVWMPALLFSNAGLSG